MDCVRERLLEAFPDIVFTEAITTPAFDKPEGAAPYSNCLAKTTTPLGESELRNLLKSIEKELGDSISLRKENIVMMDIDLLEYNGVKHHHNDWQRPYVKQLLSHIRTICILLASTLTLITPQVSFAQPNKLQSQQNNSKVTSSNADKAIDTELLGRAVEYYQSEKYHECIITFNKLQKHYKLNPRFMAYLGFCYYKEKQYEEAVKCLKDGIHELKAYSPKEQAVFIYSCAESYFNLQRYEDAITYYRLALPHTEGNDKADILFHTAFSYYLQENFQAAQPLFSEALALYKSNTSSNDELHVARLRQTETMLKGLKKIINQENPSTDKQ